MTETILIVDDEDSVRRTLGEWLEATGWPCRLLTAADAEAALVAANQNEIDLAILDWNLGAGNDGLRLLEDLAVFHPDIVAILITGYAHQATPLDAMRMGVRDYLDKNHEFDRDTFLAAVRRQLDRIAPAKRERRFHQSLSAFRESVEQVLPLVRSAAALNGPVPVPAAVQSLLRFLIETTRARDGFLVFYQHDGRRDPPGLDRAYRADGQEVAEPLVPFARSLAGSVAGLGEARSLVGLNEKETGSAVELQPFEHGVHSLIAAPLPIGEGMLAVLELVDKQGADGARVPSGFDEGDRRLITAAAAFGSEMLRQALAERQTHRLLLDALAAARAAADSVTDAVPVLPNGATPPPVLEQMRQSLRTPLDSAVAADEAVRLAEAVRVLALRHGTPAVRHCIALVEDLRKLLDTVCGSGDGP